MSTATDRPMTAPAEAEFERIPLRSTLPAAGKPAAPVDPRKLVVPGMDEAESKPRPASRLGEVARPDLVFPKDDPKSEGSVGPADLDRARFPHRAMLPEALLCIGVSVAWLWGVMPYLPSTFVQPEVYAAVPGTFGLFVAVRWLFRTFAGGYRLTPAEILRVSPGPIPDPAPIELNRVASVTVEQSTLEWLLMVGRLRLSFERDTQPEEILGPIGWPKWRAKKIEAAMTAAREAGVTTRRTAA